MSPIYLLTLSALLLVSALAAWRGRVPERITAAALFLAWVGTSLFPWNGADVPWAAIILDSGVFLLLLYLALFSGRRWTLAASGFQFLVLATHAAFVLNVGLEQWAYITAYYVWNIGVILALATGVLWPRRPA